MHKLVTGFLLFVGVSAFGQLDLLAALEEEAEEQIDSTKIEVSSTWKSTYLINFHTTETEGKGALDFRIAHRFGDVGSAAGGPHTLYGFDQSTNIRFSFDYGITNKLQVGFGRSKYQENLDGFVKYKLLSQKLKGMPFSLVAVSAATLTPQKDILDYYSKFAHRMTFANQIILGSRLSDRFSILANINHVHQNLVVQSSDSNVPRDANDLLSFGIAGRAKVTKKMALVAEYAYTFGDYRNSDEVKYYHPFSCGVEIETGGHVFHINASNSPGLTYQDLTIQNPSNWLDGSFKLGFTISRTFAF